MDHKDSTNVQKRIVTKDICLRVIYVNMNGHIQELKCAYYYYYYYYYYYSHQAKVNAKAKIVFELCRLVFDPFHFRFRFRLV